MTRGLQGCKPVLPLGTTVQYLLVRHAWGPARTELLWIMGTWVMGTMVWQWGQRPKVEVLGTSDLGPGGWSYSSLSLLRGLLSNQSHCILYRSVTLQILSLAFMLFISLYHSLISAWVTPFCHLRLSSNTHFSEGLPWGFFSGTGAHLPHWGVIACVHAECDAPEGLDCVLFTFVPSAQT